MSTESKKLGHDDSSGFEFAKELLAGDVTAGINFDRIMKNPEEGYQIIEYLLCEESQPNVNPYTSHPKYYWKKNKNKFLALWRTKLDFNATLYLINYAKKGTTHEDKVLLIEVLDMDETGILKERQTRFTRSDFSKWFRDKNGRCLSDTDAILRDIYERKSLTELGSIVLDRGKYRGKSLTELGSTAEGRRYLNYHHQQPSYQYHIAVECFLRKLNRESAVKAGISAFSTRA